MKCKRAAAAALALCMALAAAQPALAGEITLQDITGPAGVSEPAAPAQEPETPAQEPETPAQEPEAPAQEPEAPAQEPEDPAGAEPGAPDADAPVVDITPADPADGAQDLAGAPVEGEETDEKNDDLITQFVKRLYTTCMGREADASGLALWTGLLRAGSYTGAQVAKGFFDSPEYQRMNRTDAQYISDLYYAIFDRAPDAGGLATWQNSLATGMSRDYVFAGFANGTEFKNLCGRFGVNPGSYASGQPRDQNPQVTAFVNRLYNVVMGRNGDESGLNMWTGLLNTGAYTGAQVAHGFFFSKEYPSGRSDDQYIADLYRAMFDRTGDSSGIATWKIVLYNGLSRVYVLNGFAGGTEFKNLCARYGITPGSVSSGQWRDKDPLVTQFVTTLARYMLNRPMPSEYEINVYAQRVLESKTSGPDLVRQFMADPSFQSYYNSLSPNDASRMLYNALLGRENDISSYEISIYVNLINSGGRNSAIEAMIKSEEFKQHCEAMHVPYTAAYEANLTVTVGSSAVTMDALRTVAGVVQAELSAEMLKYPELVKAQAVAAHSYITAQHNAGVKAPAVHWKEPTQEVKNVVNQVIDQFVLYTAGGKTTVALTPYYSHSPYTTSFAASSAWHTSAYPWLTAQSTEYDHLAKSQGGYATADQVVRIDSEQLTKVFNAMYNASGKGITLEGSTKDLVTVYQKNGSGYANNLLTHVLWFDQTQNNGAGGWVRNSTPSVQYFCKAAAETLGLDIFPSTVLKSITYDGYSNGKAYWKFTFASKQLAVGAGLGMSQWTAYGFASRQSNMNDYKKILLHFYNTVPRGSSGTNACKVGTLS